jgi:phosphatidylglycerophosphate synthase
MSQSEQPAPATSLAALQQHARTDDDGREKLVLSLHDRICARVLAPPLAWLALRLGLSADTVSFLSVVTALAGAALLAFSDSTALLSAAALLQFSYLLDCIDGDIARARGTASLNGYLRDVFRHCVAGPAMFCGLAMGSSSRHTEWFVVLAGLLGAFLSTRIVADLADRVTLDGLLRRLKTGTPIAAATATPESAKVPLGWVRRWLLPDMAIMNWVTAAVLIDVFWLGVTSRGWHALDYVLLVLSSLQLILKTGGLCLLWRRGVAARVEQLAQEIERTRRDSAG